MNRIVIIGSGGSGKTTLGRELSKKLDIPLADFDEFHWLPNWQRRPDEEFAKLILDSVEGEEWIVVGNYSKYRHLYWPKADTILWLDLPFALLLWRVISRGAQQGWNGQTFCNGNKQTPGQLWWMIKHLARTFRKKRRLYSELMESTKHVEWIHLKSRREINAFAQSRP